MTVKEFFTEVQSYYGPYPEGQRPYVYAYVKDKNPEYLCALFDELRASYSTRWKSPPDEATMKECAAGAVHRLQKRVKKLPEPPPKMTDQERADAALFMRRLLDNLFGRGLT